jgi:hypothetical protein
MTILPTSGKWLFLAMCTSLVGCGTKYRVIHKPLAIVLQCEFEKLTNDEKLTVLPVPTDKENLTHKDSMIEAVGRKIYRNQNNCKLRQVRIDSLIEAHNKAHEDKQ